MQDDLVIKYEHKLFKGSRLIHVASKCFMKKKIAKIKFAFQGLTQLKWRSKWLSAL